MQLSGIPGFPGWEAVCVSCVHKSASIWEAHCPLLFAEDSRPQAAGAGGHLEDWLPYQTLSLPFPPWFSHLPM